MGHSMNLRPVTAAARLVAAIGREPGLPTKTLAVRVGCTHRAACRLLASLEAEALVAFDRPTGGWFLAQVDKVGQFARVLPGGRPQ